MSKIIVCFECDVESNDNDNESKVDLYTVAIPPPRLTISIDVGMISRQIHLVLIQQFSLRHLEH